MELNKWYKLEEKNVQDFIELAPNINREIVAYLRGRSFKVVAFEDGDPDGVYAIQFEGEEPISRLRAMPKFTEADWSASWFYKDEWELFTEVDLDEEVYIIHVSGIEPTEYGGASGYMVGTNSWPQRFTLEAAKEHAKFVLAEESSKAQVHIFRLETTAKVITQVSFE
ncbi:hypothetical protein [Enterobacter phage ZX14]